MEKKTIVLLSRTRAYYENLMPHYTAVRELVVATVTIDSDGKVWDWSAYGGLVPLDSGQAGIDNCQKLW